MIRFGLTCSTGPGGLLPDGLRDVRVATDDVGDVYVSGRVPPGIFADRAYVPADDRADILITKLSADGTQVLFTTYLGGKGDDAPAGISVDKAGRVALVGRTTSNGFPVTAGGRAELG